jgi:hypothetical protein
MSLTRFLCPVMLLVALPLPAANREHAVTPLPTVTLSGVVRDASGAPVAGAIVTSGSSSSNRNGTATDGKYSLAVRANRPALIAVEDFAFESRTVTFTPASGATLDLTLSTPRPSLTVKLTSGETHVLDLGTSQFAYLIPFSGYARSDAANFCKPDGSPFAPAKTEIARIVGPATSVNFAPCCTAGPTMTVNVEMKSGEKTVAYFNDSCLGNEVDFVGRERLTAVWQYLRFSDIAEIDFP